MATLKSPKYHFWSIFVILLSFQGQVFCGTYQVGDLHAWGVPTSAKPQIYTKWAKNHNINVGDTLFFLYPPSEDSLIQVTRDSYRSCNLKDPILYMNNGNSLFNITKTGDYYFTSGAEGRCQKSQKLHIFVSGNGSVADPPSDGPTAAAPSYPTVFGSIPVQASAPASASPLMKVPIFMSSAVAGILVSLFAM